VKVIKEIEKTIEKHKEVDKVLCDFCGKQAYFPNGWENNMCSLIHLVGGCYPEGDCRERLEIDICNDCFEKEIVPFLESKGIAMEYENNENRVQTYLGY
jgi:hypothetical protein